MRTFSLPRKTYIQVLKAVSAFAVVLMHANGCFWTFSYDSYWLSANVIDSLCYFAVPVFFMISGATLLDYRERYSTREFLKKRFFRAFIPFLFWSIVGMAWCFIISGYPYSGILDAIEGIFLTRYVEIYWFFIPLFLLYLAVPFFSLIPAESRKKAFGWAIAAILVFNVILPFIGDMGIITYSPYYAFPAAVEYAMYLLLGYWLDRYELKLWHRIVVYALALAALVSMIIVTKESSYAYGDVSYALKGYLRLPCVLYSAGVFLLFRNLKKEKVLNFLGRITAPFSGLVFGIYLIHWYVLQIVNHFSPFPATELWYRIVSSIVVFAFSALVVWLLRKIPVVRNIVP